MGRNMIVCILQSCLTLAQTIEWYCSISALFFFESVIHFLILLGSIHTRNLSTKLYDCTLHRAAVVREGVRVPVSHSNAYELIFGPTGCTGYQLIARVILVFVRFNSWWFDLFFLLGVEMARIHSSNVVSEEVAFCKSASFLIGCGRQNPVGVSTLFSYILRRRNW